jgi:hypothetical protein
MTDLATVIGFQVEKDGTPMRKAYALLLLLPLFLTTAVFAWDGDETTVRWERIAGNINDPGTSNPVAGIPSGGLPWTTTGGRARVNLTTGQIAFNVTGLVLNGGNASGTPDGVANVKGTLVCNPGTPAQSVHDTATVPLSPEGDAEFIGTLGSLPACANPLFLIRIAANNSWIATGSVRVPL